MGDGEKATGEEITHSYGSAGDYTVNLTVKDDGGATSLISETISVGVLGLLFKEAFDGYAVGTLPLGWGKVYSGRGWEYCEVDDSHAFSPPNSLRMEGLKGWSQCLGRRIPSPPDPSLIYDYSNGLPSGEYAETVAWLQEHPQIWFEARVMVAEHPDITDEADIGNMQFYKVLPRWGQVYGGVSYHKSSSDGYFIIESSGNTRPIEPYRWYKLAVFTDLTTRRQTVWVDDTVLADDVPVEVNDWPEMFLLAATHGESYTKVWYDDVKMGYGAYTAAQPSVISSNAAGMETNTFDLSEDVYCYAGNLPSDTWVNIFVVPNKAWAVGNPIGSDVSSDGVNRKKTDSSGNIPNTKIWPAPLTAGQYDIIVDVDRNGVLDAGEPVDDMTATEGIEAVPEFSTIAIPVAAILELLFFFNYRKRRK